MPFKGGVKEAAKMLAGLDIAAREKLMQEIVAKDPQMAELLKKHMVVFEDLEHLTVKMLVELLKEVPIETFALALRLGSDSLRSHILKNVSSSMQETIKDVLNGPAKPRDIVQGAVDDVMKVVLKKVEKGELILKDSEAFV